MSAYRDIRNIRGVVVHCTATQNFKPVDAHEIDWWHAKRGFKRSPKICNLFNADLIAFGYHFLIQPDGAILSGRAIWETGAHAKGWNRSTVGIAMVGTDEFTDEALSRLWETVLSLSLILPHKPVPFLCGHRDLPDVHKACPGFDVCRTTPDDVLDYYVPFDAEVHR